jgi:hypothetical protein
MTVLTFPTNPTLGQRYNAPNQIQYVYDGVKWIVETVASTSLAVTNSVQDRVAPMFVDGDNTGITFAYNAATNTMSAEVTAVNGNTLVNGDSSFSVSSDGTLTLTHPAEPALHPLATVLTVQKAAGNYHTISGAYGLSLQATPVPSGSGLNTNTNFVDIFHDGISVNVDNNTWAFGTDGALTLAKDIIVGNNGGHIYQDAGQAGNPSSIKWVNMTGANNMLRVFADDITTLADERLNVGMDNDNGFYITTYSTTDSTWTFGVDGVLTLPAGGDIVDSTGTTVLGGGSTSYNPDDTDNWNEPTINTISAALDELAARVTALQNYEIDGGNAYTPPEGETIIDGYGA